MDSMSVVIGVEVFKMVKGMSSYSCNSYGIYLHEKFSPLRGQHVNEIRRLFIFVSIQPKISLCSAMVPKEPAFYGSRTLLKTIRIKLCDTASKEYNHRLAIYGMGGVGKTQIAIEYVMQFQTEYVGIYWITATSEVELLSGFQAIAKETHCVDDRIPQSHPRLLKGC